MGLIDVRRFSVTTCISDSGELEVADVFMAEEDEWDIDLAEVVKVNASCVPGKRSFTYRVMQNELRLLLSYLLDHPGDPVSMRHREFKVSSRHVKSFVTESFGLGMLTAAVERHFRWELCNSDLANFDVLPAKFVGQYSAFGVRPDLLFDFSSQGEERRLAGEARGRSSRRPKNVDRGQRNRLNDIVAWSDRNGFHPVTMTWAYSGAMKLQVDLFDIQVPEAKYEVGEDELDESHLKLQSPLFVYETPRLIRERAIGRVARIANELYTTAPEPSPGRARQIFGRNVRGDWVTADLVAPSNLRLFLGVLDQPLDRQQAGASRRARNAQSRARDADPIQIAVTQRILIVVARDSSQEPDWSEVRQRVEQS